MLEKIADDAHWIAGGVLDTNEEATKYIKEFEEYMHSEHHYGDVEVAISNMLKFMKGEVK